MTLSDYVIFTAVAEHRNMTHAAEKLHLTRSAISHAVSRMEQELGFALFIKTTHGISLTMNGEMLLPLAYSVIQSHHHFHETVSSINGLDAGHVRLGTCSSTCIRSRADSRQVRDRFRAVSWPHSSWNRGLA